MAIQRLQGAVARRLCEASAEAAARDRDMTLKVHVSPGRVVACDRGECGLLAAHSCPPSTPFCRPLLAAVVGCGGLPSEEVRASLIVPRALGLRDQGLQRCAGLASRSAPMAGQRAGFDEPQQQFQQFALVCG